MRGAVLGRLRQASYGGDSRHGVALARRTADRVRGRRSSTRARLCASRRSSPRRRWWRRRRAATSCSGRRASAPGAASTATATPRACGAISRASSPASTRASARAAAPASRPATPARATISTAAARANVETGHVAAYGGWSFGALNLRAGGAYAFHTHRHRPHHRVPGLLRSRDRALRRRHRPDLRRGRLRLRVRQRGGRAVRGRRLGAPRHRRRGRARRRGGAQRRGQQLRGRLFDARHPRRQHDPARRRHGADPARLGRLAARLRQRDAGRARSRSRRSGVPFTIAGVPIARDACSPKPASISRSAATPRSACPTSARSPATSRTTPPRASSAGSSELRPRLQRRLDVRPASGNRTASRRCAP